MLQRAWESVDSGDHLEAIARLQETLAKYPDSAPYAQSLLGVEYIRTDQFAAAVEALQQAVSLLPHDMLSRYDLGLALVCLGEYERGETEVRRALEIVQQSD